MVNARFRYRGLSLTTAIVRKLNGIDQDIIRLAEQGQVGSFDNAENADKLGNVVEDIRDAMMEYQVCVLDCSLQFHLTPTLEFVTTRHLRQELSAHR